MANKTVYGCVDWATGKIKFETNFSCIGASGMVEGCINWTGDHAGQVEVTISDADNPDCNDTYYACIDWSTGKFQFQMPDECCAEYSADDCECFDPGETPLYYTLIISGVTSCWDYPNCNGKFKLTQYLVHSPCTYMCLIDSPPHTLFYGLYIKEPTTTYILVRVQPLPWYFRWEGTPACQISGTEEPNDILDCEGRAGYGGGATWYPGWYT